MLDKTSSIICAFGLASAAPRSPYRHLELCGIALCLFAVIACAVNGGAKVPVDTTEVRNIWKANGARPGMVLYNNYTTVYITPRAGLEEQLREK